MDKKIKKMYSSVFERIELQKDFPLVLPNIKVDGRNVKNWQFTILTYNFNNGKSPYPVFQYTNPLNKREYIFHSKTIDELLEYLEEFKLIKN